jgi:DNA-binding transcriptional MerR regulator
MTRSFRRSNGSWGAGSEIAEAGSPIPDDKRYFRIGEVSRIVGVEPYVLRYWEGEFPQVRPARADSNQRTYQKKDLELLLEIKRLLYEEKLTIKGARKRLQGWKAPKASPEQPSPPDLDEIRRELNEILRILS